MYIGYGILGLILGGMIAGGGRYFVMGAITGAVIGLVLARLAKLEQRVRQLESADRISPPPIAETSQPKPVKWPESEPVDSGTEELPEPSATRALKDKPWETGPLPESTEAGTQAAKKPYFTWGTRDRDPSPAGPSVFDTLLKKATAWLTTGNIPVKVGVIISFIGVAFLLKYAVDRKMLVMPMEFRLLAVALAGMAMLVIGWRLRHKMRVYALSMQGGGAGILFLTIFGALRLWQMLPASLAFVLLLALTFFTGALAVLQNARSLAILGIVGGFLAPVLTSTGQGSHVALFSYYLVLNGAILGIAWFRSWRELNLIGFVFTFLIGSLWGYQYYKPEFLASTMPFLVLHFLFYQAIAILYALRQPPGKLGVVDGTLVFGTPVVSFALQAALLRDTEYGLAISAAVAGVFYALLASWLLRKKKDDLRLLVESFIALAVAFATITIPLALDARWTSAAWALEGAALIWVGTRQGRHLANLAGSALIALSGLAFMEYGWRSQSGLPILNGNLLGGLMISLSAFFAAKKLQPETAIRFAVGYRFVAVSLFVWAVLWWLGTGLGEIDDRLRTPRQAPVFLVFVALSTGLSLWLARRWQWNYLHRLNALFLPLLAVIALFFQWEHQHFLLGLSWLAWPLAWLVQALVLRVMDESPTGAGNPLTASWHVLSLLLLTTLLAIEAGWRTDQVVSRAWAIAVLSAVPGIVALLVWRFRHRPIWPVPAHPASYLAASIFLVSAQVMYLAAMSVTEPGNSDPWPYIPVLNPFDLGMLFAAVTALLSLAVLKRDSGTEASLASAPYILPYRLLLSAFFFVLTTCALVRGVHHYTGVVWDFDRLYDSVIVQTSLSVYWGLLGFTGMIWGARKSFRPIWLAGAGFMALVVLKLFLIDLGNSGTVERIVSFIAIGALLLVVGYFAPAPPREASVSAQENTQESSES